MINTKELEKRWFRYKAKGVILIFSIFTILFLLLYGGYFILYKLDLDSRVDKIEEVKETKIREIEIEPIENIEEINLTEETVPSSTIERIEEPENILLSPTIPIVDLEKENKNQHRDQRKVVHKQKEHKKIKEHTVKKANYLTVKELAVVNSHSNKIEEKKKINFHKSSNNYLNIMKEKFHENKNPREALLIAQAYYRAGNYENSEKWALKANNLDKTLDESWLLFASSQERLGKREEALKILITYYRKSKSEKAKALIEKMRTKSI